MAKKVQNISFRNVDWNVGFWQKRYALNRDVSLKSVYARFKETGRMDALLFRYKKDGLPLHFYYDSDVGKWMEAVSYLIEKQPNDFEKEQSVIDEIVDCIAERQEDGYIDSYFQQVEPEKKFQDRLNHELYCMGHLMEAAIAYHQATGKRKFLDCMEKSADCIRRVFVEEKSAGFYTPGHEEIELALIRLYRYTGKKKYLDLAGHFLTERGKHREKYYETANEKYDQSNATVYELRQVEGHAVRAMYLMIAMAMYVAETGDEGMRASLSVLTDDLLKKIYISGGIGSQRVGESFSRAFDLPNLTAYSESCAAIGLALYCLEMRTLGFDQRLEDVLERVMYNALLSSTSLSGTEFFYENPLEIRRREIGADTSVAERFRTVYPPVRRKEVFDCSCCPPNINRIFARLGDMFFAEEDGSLYICQIGSCTLKNEMIRLEIQTDFPRGGRISIRAKNNRYKKVFLRRPSWSSTSSEMFAEIGSGEQFTWEEELDMTPRFVEADPEIVADAGRVCLMRGPVLYCLEELDNGENLNALSVDPFTDRFELRLNEEHGLYDVVCDGYRDEPFRGTYRNAKKERKVQKLVFRPYFTFANRKETDMIVWIRTK